MGRSVSAAVRMALAVWAKCGIGVWCAEEARS